MGDGEQGQLVARLARDPNQFLSTIQIGITFPFRSIGPIPLQPRPGRRTTVILVSDAVGSA